MNAVTVKNLPEDTYLDKPTYLDEKYILLSPDVPITKELKDRLTAWGYERVYTDGAPQDKPPFFAKENQESGGDQQVTARYESSEKEKQQWKEAQQCFLRSAQFLSDVYEQYLKKNEFYHDEITEEVKRIMADVKEHRRFLLRLSDLDDPNHSYIISHSVKTTIVSLVLGDALKLPIFKQIELGTAALLHNIGMLRIPPQLYMSNRRLSPEERKTLAAHTILSFRILKEAGFSMMVTRAVLEHHERIDGSGHPRGLEGEKISFFARIIAVAGSYSAIISKRPYREAQDAHTGILDLLKNTGKQYDEKIIRLLVYTISLYPVGTYVVLSNGAQGVVVETNAENPKLPVVRVLVNERGAPLRDQPLLYTSADNGLQVKRPLVPSEIEAITKASQ